MKRLGFEAISRSARLQRVAVAAFALALMCGVAGSAYGQISAPPRQQAPASAGENSSPVNSVPEKQQEVKDENDEYRHSAAVQKLGSMVGMNTEQAAAAFTVFNFLVLAIGVGFVMVKTLPKAFRTRNTLIQKQLVDARTATEEANARLNSVESRLAKLDEQIAGMRSQAEADSARDERRIRAGVEEDKTKILAAAEAEIQAATSMARREIQQFAAELAIEQAARKLVVTPETDRLLVENFARQLTGPHGGQN
ncbi:MAG TPA: ATP synthase F0 subunit B [Acidobacteriaceae bacterium]|jgi:F-type H+-transporting ATPase subunit b|nr:ATP synthase F0 subunit B [Acidobacteriaceae bacterium]